MSAARESWSWEGCEGRPADVEVYARGAAAELLLNGKPMGRRPLKNCLARFRLAYAPGTLEAVSYDEAGRPLGRCALRTAGETTVLRAVPEASTVAPGHLAFIRLQYTDTDGTVKPLARGNLRVTVHCGKLLGLGSACPYNPAGFLTNTTDTYYGQALAIVLASGQGPVLLTVTDNEHTARAEVPVL